MCGPEYASRELPIKARWNTRGQAAGGGRGLEANPSRAEADKHENLSPKFLTLLQPHYHLAVDEGGDHEWSDGAGGGCFPGQLISGVLATCAARLSPGVRG